MTEKQKQELFAMLFYAKQDYRRRVQIFGSTDEIVEIASARVATLRAVVDLLELGKPYAEWEAAHQTKLSKMQGGNHENQKKEHRLFIGTPDQAREAATDIRRQALNDGHSDVRVEVWQVIATSYQGTVRR